MYKKLHSAFNVWLELVVTERNPLDQSDLLDSFECAQDLITPVDLFLHNNHLNQIYEHDSNESTLKIADATLA